MEKLPQRIKEKIRVTDTCWIWVASKDSSGYGHCSVNGKIRPAHRVCYELIYGGVSRDLDLDHLCRVKNCVNPDHLEPVTRSENTLRGKLPSILRERRARINTCPLGHPYDTENTYLRKDRPGRECKKCRTESARKYRNARTRTTA